MTVYQCDKGHQFTHAATISASVSTEKLQDQMPQNLIGNFPADIEYHCCPQCQSIVYFEVLQPEPQTEKVHIYEVKESGPQPVLDALLAEGYRIVYRTQKQYNLEKCKEPQKP